MFARNCTTTVFRRVIGLLLLLCLAASACSPASTATTDAVTSAQHTSFDLIEKDLQEGKITEKEAVWMSLQAAFQPEDLPGKYQGAPLDASYGMNGELQWIIDHWDELNEQDKKRFEPYILPPDHADSIFNPASLEKRTFSLIPVVQAATSDWKYELIKPGGSATNVTITYYMPDSETAEDKAATLENVARTKDALNKAWPKYKALLGVEPTNNFSLYLGDISNLAFTHGVSDKKLVGVHGFATWSKSGNCMIAIERSLINEQLDSAVIHELFHCFQFYMGLTFFGENRDLLWLMEATAVWAENFIYPDSMMEWEYLDIFFGSLHQNRIFANKAHEYGSYMFFFFLSQYLGNNEHIRDVLEDARDGDIPMTITFSVEDYLDAYPVFALYNWNQAPWKMYKDTPDFPNRAPVGSIVDCLDIVPAKLEYKEELGKGSIKYMHHTFDDDITKIRKVIFDFTGVNTSEYLSRQALIKVGGAWTYEDWSEVNRSEFCRRNPGENVQEVILILANANLMLDNQVTYTVDTEQDCEIAKAAFMRITQTLNLGGALGLQSILESQEVIQYVADEDISGFAYKIMERHMTYTYQQSNVVTDPDMGFTASITGSGSLVEVFQPNDEMPVRFVEGHDGKVMFLSGYDSDKSSDWVTFHRSMTSGGITNTYTDKGEPIFNFLGGFPDFQLEEGEILPGKYKGRRVQEFTDSSGGVITTVIEFEYDRP